MHVDNQQTTFRSLTKSELDQVSGGLVEIVLGAAAMVGILAAVVYTDNVGTLKGLRK